MNFACSLCGKEHRATEKYNQTAATQTTTEERAALRDAYLKAFELWEKNLNTSNEESFEKKLIKTEFAYFGALPGADVWLRPKELTTSRQSGKNGKLYSHCIECPR